MFEIRLFGSPQILQDQRPVKLDRRKSRALLFYLAAHSNPVSREHLLATFWMDLPRPAALQTLRTTLHHLRRVLGPALITDDEKVALDAGTRVDARMFEQFFNSPSVDIRPLEDALDLYQGDFLADFSLRDSQAFEDWMLFEREHFRRLYVRGLALLSSLYEANQDYQAALASLDRALALNPLQEDLQRERIRLYFLAGDRPGAIQHYDELRKLLDEELGVPPMAETRALYDAIISDHFSIPSRQTKPAHSSAAARQKKSSDPLPFTGRDAELRKLTEMSAQRKLILIEGDAGIGKTRLAKEFLQTAKAIALLGTARELEQTLPYQPVIEALRSLLSHPDWILIQSNLRKELPAIWWEEASRLLPELAVSASDGQQANIRAADESRLWEGIHQFLAAIARQRPLIVFLDDIHWADSSTLALLGYLVRQSMIGPISFLASTRPVAPRTPLASLLQALIREDRLARLVLSPLSEEDVNRIAASLNSEHTGPLADWLSKYSEGNPFILAELVRHVREKGWIDSKRVVDLEALTATPVVPQTVYSLIQSRIERLSDAARRILDAAVAAGREFEFEVVGQAAGLSENAALDALDELLAAGLVYALEGSRFTFDHTLTMEVAYREVGELRHRQLHRRVAEALESIHRDQLDRFSGQLAWHFAEGKASERAFPYAFRAGQQASRLAAWKEAIVFFEQALKGSPPEQRVSVLMALGEVTFLAGQFVRSTEVFKEALNLVQITQDEEMAAKIQLQIARAMLPQARFHEIIAIVEQVCAAIHPSLVVEAELTWGTALSLEGADLEAAENHLRTAEEICMAVTPNDYANLAHIKFEQGSIAAQKGDLQQAIKLYKEALTAASQSDTDDAIEFRILSYNNLAYHLHLLGDPSAQAFALDGIRLAKDRGVISLQTYLLSTLGEIAMAGEDLETAERYFMDGLNLAEQLSVPERIAGLTANLGLVAIRLGQTELAIYRLSTALALADSLGTQHLAAQIRIWLVPLLPPIEAHTRLSEARAIAESSGRRRLLDEVNRLEQKRGRSTP